jgi:hypothetical protein
MKLKKIIPVRIKIYIKSTIKSFKLITHKLLEKKISRLNLVDTFPSFRPASPGSYKMYEDSIITNINSTLQTLSSISLKSKVLDIISVEDLAYSNKEAARLDKLFQKYNSDKSTMHDYHKIYAHYFHNNKTFTLIEIGIGTNNTDVISNMSKYGSPGASLYAFSEAYPNSKIIGCDIDRRILFNTDNIKTFFLDQNNYSTFSALSQYKNKVDFIIDDGLHSQNANLNSMLFALESLKVGGVLFIEDIPEYSLDVWHIANNLLPSNFEFQMIKAKTYFCGVMKRIN